MWERVAGWLRWQGAIVPVALYGIGKVAAGLLHGQPWYGFDITDAAVLAILAVCVAVMTWLLDVRVQRMRAEAEQQRCQAAMLQAQNEVATRVTRAMACELAQPLSGAMAYSELLMLRADRFSGFERRELEGLREGVLQIDHLLQTLRQILDAKCGVEEPRHVADEVERGIAAPRPRLRVHGAVASVGSDSTARF